MLIVTDVSGEPYCVYAHVIDDAVIYVGHGTLARAFDMFRGEAWHEVVAGRAVTVQVWERHDSEDAAAVAARGLLRGSKPPVNAIMRVTVGDGRSKRVRCVDTGVEYDSVSAAARAHNLSQSSVSNVISGRYASVRNLRFERVK